MPSPVNRVGTSSMKPFTPMGEKHLPPSSIQGLIPCILFDFVKEATIWVRPGRVRAQVAKYKALGQVLNVPKAYDLDKKEPLLENVTADVPVEYAHAQPVARPRRNPKCRPVICRNTGQFFDSIDQIATHYKLSQQLTIFHLSGKGSQAKGHLFRYATPEEIEAADKDIHWNSGEHEEMAKKKGKNQYT